MGTGSLSPGSKRPEPGVDPLHPVASRLEKSIAIFLLPLSDSMTCRRVKFIFSLLLMCVYLLDEECDKIRKEIKQGLEEWENSAQSN